MYFFFNLMVRLVTEVGKHFPTVLMMLVLKGLHKLSSIEQSGVHFEWWVLDDRWIIPRLDRITSRTCWQDGKRKWPTLDSASMVESLDSLPSCIHCKSRIRIRNIKTVNKSRHVKNNIIINTWQNTDHDCPQRYVSNIWKKGPHQKCKKPVVMGGFDRERSGRRQILMSSIARGFERWVPCWIRCVDRATADIEVVKNDTLQKNR